MTASVFASVKLLLLIILSVVLLAILTIKVVRVLVNLFRGEADFLTRGLPYIYVLRFPVLTALILVGLPYLSFLTDARSLLENLFDLR